MLTSSLFAQHRGHGTTRLAPQIRISECVKSPYTDGTHWLSSPSHVPKLGSLIWPDPDLARESDLSESAISILDIAAVVVFRHQNTEPLRRVAGARPTAD